ncbi:hypothetical protein EXIGLDRAFT_780886 [Exidia glandulosa HHB12029]|uniref:Uncharacterized protein n=1 Tax=Exidia glandulosa HHB12029 TaxID=1314781 RepID=A0A165BF15_EXIGL|nr:hypothetical protein EXIGLDRAFT_780886 [Exidia glandulosa HHB12029]
MATHIDVNAFIAGQNMSLAFPGTVKAIWLDTLPGAAASSHVAVVPIDYGSRRPFTMSDLAVFHWFRYDLTRRSVLRAERVYMSHEVTHSPFNGQPLKTPFTIYAHKSKLQAINTFLYRLTGGKLRWRGGVLLVQHAGPWSTEPKDFNTASAGLIITIAAHLLLTGCLDQTAPAEEDWSSSSHPRGERDELGRARAARQNLNLKELRLAAEDLIQEFFSSSKDTELQRWRNRIDNIPQWHPGRGVLLVAPGAASKLHVVDFTARKAEAVAAPAAIIAAPPKEEEKDDISITIQIAVGVTVDFAAWYLNVLIKVDMLEYYSVSWLNQHIIALDVENAYFRMFVSAKSSNVPTSLARVLAYDILMSSSVQLISAHDDVKSSHALAISTTYGAFGVVRGSDGIQLAVLAVQASNLPVADSNAHVIQEAFATQFLAQIALTDHRNAAEPGPVDIDRIILPTDSNADLALSVSRDTRRFGKGVDDDHTTTARQHQRRARK